MVRTLGDVVVWARPAVPDTFSPFGRVLGAGDRLPFGNEGGTLFALDEIDPGPRRFTHLSCYPEARRLILPVGDASLLLLAVAGGEGGRAYGPPVAFAASPGQGLLLEAGVWHAGPVALRPGVVLEALETREAVDRLDRSAVRVLLGVEAVRVGLPGEPGAPTRPLDLSGPGAVLVDPSIGDLLTVGLLHFDDLDVVSEHPGLVEEIAAVSAGLREGAAASPEGVAVTGSEAVRALWHALGLDPTRQPAPPEEWARAVLAHEPLRFPDSLTGVLALTALRRQVVLAGHDAGSLSTPLHVRRGRIREEVTDAWGRSAAVPALPLLCDGDGPVGGPLGSVRRARLRPGTRSALAVLYLPSSLETLAVEAHLEETSRTVRRWCGGVETGRLAIRQSE